MRQTAAVQKREKERVGCQEGKKERKEKTKVAEPKERKRAGEKKKKSAGVLLPRESQTHSPPFLITTSKQKPFSAQAPLPASPPPFFFLPQPTHQPTKQKQQWPTTSRCSASSPRSPPRPSRRRRPLGRRGSLTSPRALPPPSRSALRRSWPRLPTPPGGALVSLDQKVRRG